MGQVGYTDFLLLFVEFLVVFIWGGMIFYSMLKKSLHNYLEKNELLLAGIGIAPYLLSLLIYYLFLIIPALNTSIYLLFILAFFLVPTIYYRKELRANVKTFSALLLKQKLLFIPVLLFVTGWLFYLSIKAITEHDTLEYVVQGGVFFKDRFIHYSAQRLDDASGFYYVGLHGFSFPLLATFELMVNDFFGTESDLFFRMLNSFYGILILLFIWTLAARRVNLLFGLVLTICLGLTYGFFETIMKYHIDLFRIYFIIISIYLMYLLVNQYSKKLLVVTALFLAAQANAHSLGCMLSIIQLGLLFFFLQGTMLRKIQQTCLAVCLFVLFGGIHYILDVFVGTGWIFQEIKFY